MDRETFTRRFREAAARALEVARGCVEEELPDRMRFTYLGQVTDNLSGVMYLASHTQPATTARYLRPQKQAAVEVLAAAARAAFRPNSGRAARPSERRRARVPKNKAPNHLR